MIDPPSYANVLAKWYKELETQPPGVFDITTIPIILVGTKMDLRDDYMFLKQLTDKGLSPKKYEDGEEMAKKINAKKYLGALLSSPSRSAAALLHRTTHTSATQFFIARGTPRLR